uniref:site-specific DNA-methyltransferase (adenine-specific) n=1 Tax=Thermogemmatispora argillosa TaxID=2045280 RepID=A0A455T2T2_9CHLR|nr:hypothetical protein KTA_24270 [Thermogemmatispora argillosa]
MPTAQAHRPSSAISQQTEAARRLSELKERTCEALVLLLTALLRQARALLAKEAAASRSERDQLARLALQDLRGLYEQTLRLIYRLFFIQTARRAGYVSADCALNLDSREPARQRSNQPGTGAPDGEVDEDDASAGRLWKRLQELCALMRSGCQQPGLRLASYPGRLFDPATTPYLEALAVPDAVLIQVLALLDCDTLAGEVTPETDWIWLPAALYEDLLAYEPRLASEPLHEVQDRGRRLVIPARLNVSSPARDGRTRYPVVRAVAPGNVYLMPSRGRKSRGSYSTPPALVPYLVRRTLEPLVSRCRRAEDMLALRVVDPAMGTGTLLVAACDYLTRAYVRLLGEGETLATAPLECWKRYRRLVAEHCLYGVDLDELAVELARLSLWLFTGHLDQAAPFVSANLRCGNSLISIPLPDAHVRSEAPARSRRLDRLLRLIPLPENALPATTEERARMRRLADLWVALWFWPRASSSAARDQTGGPENEAVPALPDRRTWAALVAAVARGEDGSQAEATAGSTKSATDAAGTLGLAPYLQTLRRLVRRMRPFHWQLEFSSVFFEDSGRLRSRPGFDAVLTNPPWETLKPNSREFFAAYDPLYRRLERVEAEQQRRHLLADHHIERAWQDEAHWLEGLSRYVRQSGLYPAQRVPIGSRASGGDLNSYKLFVERVYQLLRPGGSCGLVVPASLYTDQSSAGLRRLLLDRARLIVLLGFENRAGLFPIDSRCKFALLVFTRERPAAHFRAAFMLRDPAVLQSDEQQFTIALPRALIERFAPETLSLLELRTQREAELLSRIYGTWPLLGAQPQEREAAGAWSVTLTREFDMTSDRRLFNRSGEGWPLYEGKMIHQYCPCFAPARYHVVPEIGRQALLRGELERLEQELDELARIELPQPLQGGRRERLMTLLTTYGRGPLTAADVRFDCEAPRLVFRRVASSTNARSLIATILPAGCFLGNTLTYVRPWRLNRDKLLALVRAGPAQPLSLAYERSLSPTLLAYLCGLLNSFVLDYVIRHKVSVDITMSQAAQLPLARLDPEQPYCQAIARRVARLVCLGPAFAHLRSELLGAEDAPTLPPEQRRARLQLQHEIDALVAHLYGLSAADLRDLLYGPQPQSFPLVPASVKEGVLRAFADVERLLESD